MGISALFAPSFAESSSSQPRDCVDNIYIIKKSPNKESIKLDGTVSTSREEKIQKCKKQLCGRSWMLKHGQYIYTFFKDGTFRGFSPQNGSMNKGRWEIEFTYSGDTGSRYLGKGKYGVALMYGPTLTGKTTWDLTIGSNGEVNIEMCTPIAFVDPQAYVSANAERFKLVQNRMLVLISKKWKLADSTNPGHFPTTLAFQRNMALTLKDSTSAEIPGYNYWSLDGDKLTLEIRSPGSGFGNMGSGGIKDATLVKFTMLNNNTLVYDHSKALYVSE